VCQLRPLVYSLGSNNMPRISFKLVKSRIKNIQRFKQGASQCKMVGAGFQCIAKLRALIPRFATIRITAWQSALNIYCGLPTPALRPNMNPADGSNLWQSALKCRLWTLAISSTAIFVVAIRGHHTAVCYGSVKDLSAEFSKRVKSSSRHFTSRGRLFEMSYLFKARLYQFKTNTRSIV
jgi:hypothetical protein